MTREIKLPNIENRLTPSWILLYEFIDAPDFDASFKLSEQLKAKTEQTMKDYATAAVLADREAQQERKPMTEREAYNIKILAPYSGVNGMKIIRAVEAFHGIKKTP